MKKKLYVTTAILLFLIAPVVAGADEPTATETLPCHPDHAEETTETTPAEPNATESSTSEETLSASRTTMSLYVTGPPAAVVMEQTLPATTTITTPIETNATTNTTPTPDPSPPPPSLPTHYPAGAVIITELYPTPPTGAAEWVELWNATNVAIDLAEFSLTDASGSRSALAGSVATGEYFLVSNPKGKLNNDGDTVALFDATGNQLDVVSYTDDIRRMESFARSGATWFVTTTPTPLGPNVVSGNPEPTPTPTEVATTVTPDPAPTTPSLRAEPVATPLPSADPITISIVATTAPEAVRIEQEPTAPPEPVEDKLARAKTSKSENKSAREVPLTDVKNLKVGAVVRTQGVVSVPPGIFGTNTFYVAGSGIRVSLFGVSPPELAIGDLVSLEGKLGSTQGESRIAISKLEGIAVVAHGEPPTPHAITVGEIGDETEGWLVKTEGTVIQKLDDRFILDDGAGSIPVVLYEAAHIDMTSIDIGDTVRVVGIVSETSAGFRLLPRSPEDVAVMSRAAPATTTNNNRPRISSLSVLAGLCVVILLGMVARKMINRQKPMALKRPLVM